MIALEIAIGVAVGIVVIPIAFWGCNLLCYLIVTLFECIGKWLNK